MSDDYCECQCHGGTRNWLCIHCEKIQKHVFQRDWTVYPRCGICKGAADGEVHQMRDPAFDASETPAPAEGSYHAETDHRAVSKVWEALGITEYTGKAIWEEVSALKEELAAARGEIERLKEME